MLGQDWQNLVGLCTDFVDAFKCAGKTVGDCVKATCQCDWDIVHPHIHSLD